MNYNGHASTEPRGSSAYRSLFSRFIGNLSADSGEVIYCSVLLSYDLPILLPQNHLASAFAHLAAQRFAAEQLDRLVAEVIDIVRLEKHAWNLRFD
jgi:hypothetical protein